MSKTLSPEKIQERIRRLRLEIQRLKLIEKAARLQQAKAPRLLEGGSDAKR